MRNTNLFSLYRVLRLLARVFEGGVALIGVGFEGGVALVAHSVALLGLPRALSREPGECQVVGGADAGLK